MKQIQDLYNIARGYSERKMYNSDLAARLHISYNDARMLTQALGFHKGRLGMGKSKPASLKEFSDDPDVVEIAKKYN